MTFTNKDMLVPTGISGDVDQTLTDKLPGEIRQDYGRRAYFAELIDRFEDGQLTPEEEHELETYFSAQVAQSYN